MRDTMFYTVLTNPPYWTEPKMQKKREDVFHAKNVTRPTSGRCSIPEEVIRFIAENVTEATPVWITSQNAEKRYLRQQNQTRINAPSENFHRDTASP